MFRTFEGAELERISWISSKDEICGRPDFLKSKLTQYEEPGNNRTPFLSFIIPTVLFWEISLEEAVCP